MDVRIDQPRQQHARTAGDAKLRGHRIGRAEAHNPAVAHQNRARALTLRCHDAFRDERLTHFCVHYSPHLR